MGRAGCSVDYSDPLVVFPLFEDGWGFGVGGVVGDYDVVFFKLEGCASLEEPVEDF